MTDRSADLEERTNAEYWQKLLDVTKGWSNRGDILGIVHVLRANERRIGRIAQQNFDAAALAAATREREAAAYAIPSLTGCCIACGDRLDITQGPVNAVTCVRVRPHCACNQGVHLWQSLAALGTPATPEER